MIRTANDQRLAESFPPSPMDERPDRPSHGPLSAGDSLTAGPDEQQGFLNAIADRANIDGDIVEFAPGMWAIHGSIPVDGEVIVAHFGSKDEARLALSLLSRHENPPEG